MKLFEVEIKRTSYLTLTIEAGRRLVYRIEWAEPPQSNINAM
jgi:hypothetical protein